MAGKGQRFIDDGYKTLNLLFQFQEEKCLYKPIKLLPKVKNYSFTVGKTFNNSNFDSIKKKNNLVFVKNVMKKTNGQATSAKLYWTKFIKNKTFSKPLIVGACDHGSIFYVLKNFLI